MKSVKVSLSMAESVKSFVHIVSKYSFDMDLRSGKFVIDAKSLLGVFSLDLSKPVVLEVYSDECGDLLKELERFTVK